LPVTAFDRTGATKLADGKILTVDNQIDTTTGTVKVKAMFENQDESLYPNQFVNVQVNLDTISNVVAVPSAAVLRGAPGTFVYLVKDDNTVTVRPVKTGPSTVDSIAILDGLTDGDKVVIDGTDKLREGASISVPGK
jgi:multidrug efflux system membrane fusion protein